MEYLFLLAERIVKQLKTELISNKKTIGNYSFDKSVIQNASLEIYFKNNSSIIKCQLSVHPLDMPWKINISVNNIRIDFDHEIYPDLLKTPDTLGNELAIKLAKYTVNYIKNN